MAAMEREPQQTGRTDLSDLVRARRADRRLSLRAVEGLTVNAETGEPLIKYSWLNKLEKGLVVVPPDVAQLQALADALDLPLGRLQDAAGAQFFGIDTVWSSSGAARALVQRADRLTPEQLEQLMRLIDTFAPPE